MSAFTMADFHEKNRAWFTNDAFLIEEQGALSHGEYVDRVAGLAESLRAQGVAPGQILAHGLGAEACALLYGLADTEGYDIAVVGPGLESGRRPSLGAAVRPALVVVSSEPEGDAANVVLEVHGPYREIRDAGAFFHAAGVRLYAATQGAAEAVIVPGRPHVFIEPEDGGVRMAALTADEFTDAVRAVCAELALNHHDRCLWALPAGSLLGRLALACVFYRGAAGMEGGRPDSVAPVRPTVIFTNGNEELGTAVLPGPDGRGGPKVVRLLAGADVAAGARVSTDLSSATLAAVGCPLPTFRLFAREAAGPEAPAGSVLATPLLGVEVKLVDGSGAETLAGGMGRLLVRARFAPRVAVAADAGAAVAVLAAEPAGEGFVRTGYLARWAQPGRMWLWPDPGDGNAVQGGGRP